MRCLWRSVRGKASSLSYLDLLALSIKKNAMLVGGWTETAYYPSVIPSLSVTGICVKEYLSPADLLFSDLAQHPPSSSLSASNLTFFLQELLNWIFLEPFLNLVQLTLGSAVSWTFYWFSTRKDLGLAVPCFISKHMRNLHSGFFSSFLCAENVIPLVCHYGRWHALQTEVWFSDDGKALWSCKVLDCQRACTFCKKPN